jgi:hypothetical protein
LQLFLFGVKCREGLVVAGGFVTITPKGHSFALFGYLKNVSPELKPDKNMKMILNSKVHL